MRKEQKKYCALQIFRAHNNNIKKEKDEILSSLEFQNESVRVSNLIAKIGYTFKSYFEAEFYASKRKIKYFTLSEIESKIDYYIYELKFVEVSKIIKIVLADLSNDN